MKVACIREGKKRIRGVVHVVMTEHLQLCLSIPQRCPLPNMAAVQIAVRLTYVLKHWSLEDWPVEPLG